MRSLTFLCAIAAVTCVSGYAQPAADARVMHVRYNCAAPSAEPCELDIGKTEFDALVRAIDPKMSPNDRQALAAEYARLLIMAEHARAHSIDRSAEFEALRKFSALQLLSTQLVKQMNAGAVPVTAEDEEAYYRAHARDYQDVVLTRIFIPPQPDHGGNGAAKTKDRAGEFRSRAVTGQDFAALQREATGGSADAVPPAPPREPVLCGALPEDIRPVCDLRAGEISAILPEGPGYSIYRLESKHPRQFAEVRQEIRTTLERQRLQANLGKVRNPITLDLDEGYFGKLPSADVAHKHGMHFPATSAAPTGHEGHH
jgi:PPIC-type PPIASE domain